MVELKVAALKVTLPFKAGQLPISIDPDNPAFIINLTLPLLSANVGRKEPLDFENPGVSHLKAEEPSIWTA